MCAHVFALVLCQERRAVLHGAVLQACSKAGPCMLIGYNVVANPNQAPTLRLVLLLCVGHVSLSHLRCVHAHPCAAGGTSDRRSTPGELMNPLTDLLSSELQVDM